MNIRLPCWQNAPSKSRGLLARVKVAIRCQCGWEGYRIVRFALLDDGKDSRRKVEDWIQANKPKHELECLKCGKQPTIVASARRNRNRKVK